MTELFHLYDRVIIKRRVGDAVSEFRGEIRSKPCLDVLAAEYDVLLEGDFHTTRILHADIQLAGERQASWIRKAYRIDLEAEEKADPDVVRAKKRLRMIPRWIREPVIEEQAA